ncbi:hypothetical protein [Microbacterium sp. 3J1]|uniref:hypothetical protein n=1 Tax=Microbacterium sp. 3J1 TaxID=861269 RepID=UPI000AF2FF8B|nr:hypothetical protein [Microbacterium sp. 3J1]
MTASHLAPSSCFICGRAPHEPLSDEDGTHAYWSNADADAEAAEHDRQVVAAGGPTYPSMTDVETLDPREAVYS